MLNRLLFPEKVNIQRRAYVWNLTASALFALQSALFLLVITRTGGETEGGQFIILFTVAQMLYSVGNYSMRDYQVSDLQEAYSFPTYYATRTVTVTAMILAAAGYCVGKQLTPERAGVMFALVGYRLIESFEDVVHGAVQKKGRFDAASISMTLRVFFSSAVFCAAYIVTKNQITASCLMLLTAGITFGLTTRVLRKQFPETRPGFDFRKTGKLLLACFPLFAGGFMNSYLTNAAKYAIDDLMGGAAQTVFNVLIMPVFAINLLSLFVYKPLIVRMSATWNEGKTGAFLGQAARQGGLIAGLTVLVAVAGNLIGVKILEIIYGIPLAEYRWLFTVLLLFGGIGALGLFLNAVITIMRKQPFILLGYGISFLANLLLTHRLVRAHGIAGAGYAYGVMMGVLLICDLAVILVTAGRRRRAEGGKTDAD